LLVCKQDFNAVGGFNEQSLAVAFNDVDLCLKVVTSGKRNVYCAEAELFHHESVSRGTENTPEKRARFEREVEYLQSHWAHFIASDPAYNPNLTLRRENFALKE
jgi:GT2 family glycosyltransferase